MSWPIRLLDSIPAPVDTRVGDAVLMRPEVPAFRGLLAYWGSRLSAEYEAERRTVRPPLLVFLPGTGWWCIDAAYSAHGRPVPDRASWSVTGDLPRITVSPSLNIPGAFHGWIRDGVISDDVEGRRFNDQGRQS